MESTVSYLVNRRSTSKFVRKTSPSAQAASTIRAIIYGIRSTEKGRRPLRSSHFATSAVEMKRVYFDVLHTGESCGVSMPHLSALRERIESYPAKQKRE